MRFGVEVIFLILAHQQKPTYERKHVGRSFRSLKQFMKIRVQSCSIECGCSSMVEQKLPKLTTGVRFPSPAPIFFFSGFPFPNSYAFKKAVTRKIFDRKPTPCS